MAKGIFYCNFKLKKDVNTEDFLKASEKLNNEFISKQKGYISWVQLNDNEEWSDIITFETFDDVINFLKESEKPRDVANDFYSYINLNSCIHNTFSVKKEYKN